ncbi:MAG: zinc ribbon-containing protein [Desulfuromonadales bacterium]|nr:zinc ribbon-containing protein [Desulfuromonadales bacterium]
MADQKTNNDDHEEVGLYEKIASRTAELLEEGRKTFDEALKKAKEEIASAGDYSREHADKIGEYVQRDLKANANKAVDAVKKSVEPQRLAAGAQSAFSRILTSAAETLTGLAEKSEKLLEFKTGEITSPGTLTCKDCETEMHITKTVRIPPCPKCHKTLFRKSY